MSEKKKLERSPRGTELKIHLLLVFLEGKKKKSLKYIEKIQNVAKQRSTNPLVSVWDSAALKVAYGLPFF